jgi:hypothetical protein
VDPVICLFDIQHEEGGWLLGVPHPLRKGQVVKDVVPDVPAADKGCLQRVDQVVQGWLQAVADGFANKFVVALQKRDGPVAAELGAGQGLAFVDQGDDPLTPAEREGVSRRRSRHNGSLRKRRIGSGQQAGPEQRPEDPIHLVRDAVRARGSTVKTVRQCRGDLHQLQLAAGGGCIGGLTEVQREAAAEVLQEAVLCCWVDLLDPEEAGGAITAVHGMGRRRDEGGGVGGGEGDGLRLAGDSEMGDWLPWAHLPTQLVEPAGALVPILGVRCIQCHRAPVGCLPNSVGQLAARLCRQVARLRPRGSQMHRGQGAARRLLGGPEVGGLIVEVLAVQTVGHSTQATFQAVPHLTWVSRAARRLQGVKLLLHRCPEAGEKAGVVEQVGGEGPATAAEGGQTGQSKVQQHAMVVSGGPRHHPDRTHVLLQ